MMKFIIGALFFVIFCSLSTPNQGLFAQVSTEWEARYNGAGNSGDEAYSIAVDKSGNVYVTGWSTGIGGNYDFATIKYDANGSEQWVQRYNGPGDKDDGAYSVAIDGAGNVFVTGYSNGITTGEDMVTIKYDSNGLEQWIQRYNGEGNGQDRATSMAIDNSGNVYVSGYSTGSGTGLDYTTIKYNSQGEQLWIAIYNGPVNGKDKATSIVVNGLGNAYVTGYSWGKGTDYDITTIKYDENGIQMWVNRYNGPGNSDDETTSIDIDGEGNVYVTGGSMGNGTGYDFATIKYDSEGLQQWVKRYNGPAYYGDDMAKSITVDRTGNIYITGQSSGYGSAYDYCTIKYNSSGDSLWVKRYNGQGNTYDSPSSIAVDDLGNVFVTGFCREDGSGYDYTTIKYNSEGDQDWIHHYNGTANYDDSAYFIVVDASGYVYVTGKSSGKETGGDYVTIKIRAR